ncbi:MAG: N-acetylneuraminate synthase [Candidatus Omnitrophica bacterium]|nr:N-acetylneuraminate synthase [Candidatus Omnitrophota bacterium]
MRPTVLALIPARGGSKGIPRKCLQPFSGLPLIAHTIRLAKQSRWVDRCVVSTDSRQIAEVARRYGAEVPFMRPAALAKDEAGLMEVVLHALLWLEAHESYRPEFLLLLQPTSPLRALEDIDRPIRLAQERKADGVVSVCPAHPHPYWTKGIDREGRLVDWIPPGVEVSRRQELPPLYALNGAVFLERREVLLRRKSWTTERTYAYRMPPERSLDIDLPWQMRLGEGWLSTAAEASFEIAGRPIGSKHPCFVIAEAGVNHNGSLQRAKELVEAAKRSGADAVKFQTFRAEQMTSPFAPKAAYQKRSAPRRESQLEMLKRLELSRPMHEALMDHCRRQGILFLSSPFDEESADLLEALGVEAFKVPSGELTHLRFLAHLARKGKPMIVSTGMSTLEEVTRAVDLIRQAGNPPLALLHCLSAYPADPAHLNLRSIPFLEKTFRVPVGFSDHTLGEEASLAAVALGASILEKHFTLSRFLPGPDHAVSLEPDRLKAWVRGIRLVESALGSPQKAPAPEEREIAAVARKSLVASRDIPAGRPLTRSLVAAKRPGVGISPALLPEVLGKITTREIPEGTLLTEEMFR